jgi:O-antigen/teichoic acid export membrane protein
MAPELVQAWVGPDFAGTVIVVRLLSFTVVVRIGIATAHTLLKAAGRHRLVAFTNVASSFVNLSLSLALVKPFGLTGVALGTLVPVCLTSMFIVFPAGCRRVQLSMRRVVAEAMWPALWPAAVMTAYVWVTLPFVGASLLAVAGEMAAACLVYGVTFLFFGLRTEERRFYLAKAMELLPRRLPAPSVSEGA